MDGLSPGTKTGRTIVVVKKGINVDAFEEQIAVMLERESASDVIDRVAGAPQRELLLECNLAIFKRSIAVVNRFLAEFIVSAEDERVIGVPEDADGGDDPTDPYTHLPAVGVPLTSQTGDGVAVAILDTGIVEHPDFKSQIGIKMSFVGGDTVDRNGHGTHCAGLIVGPTTGDRPYGIAPKATLHVGKVLGDDGLGVDWDILRGFCWASHLPARVIVMCLGSTATKPSDAYESIADTVHADGGIVIAAAGNKEPGNHDKVNHPANCSSIFATGAMTQDVLPADFSCVKENDGDYVEFFEPGVGVRSAWYDFKHRRQTGTSMSAAICAGVAALWAQYLGPNEALAPRLIEEQKKADVLRCP